MLIRTKIEFENIQAALLDQKETPEKRLARVEAGIEALALLTPEEYKQYLNIYRKRNLPLPEKIPFDFTEPLYTINTVLKHSFPDTLLGIAIHFEYFDIAKLLIAHNAECSPKKMVGSYFRWNENVVDFLIEMKCDLETIGSSSQTLLMKAARYGHTSAVQRLLEAGAKVETAGSISNALSLSTDPVCAALLLAYGASISEPAPFLKLIEDYSTLASLFCLSDYLRQDISVCRSEALSLWNKRYPSESKELHALIHLHLPPPGLSDIVMDYCFFKSDTLKRKKTEALADMSHHPSNPWPQKFKGP